jgi:hypothetical protein
MTRPLRRRSDAGELEPLNPRSYEIWAADAARTGSAALLSAIKTANSAEPPAKPKRPLTFEEQLRLVTEGRARVVPKPIIPRAEYPFTLAGVSEPL